MNEKYIEVSDEVREAVASGKPVVSLESTIISHGMPYPQNVETALGVESVIRDRGAVPATVAIIKGKLRAGISADEIEYLGKKGIEVVKTSRRDIPFIVSGGLDGATTVASTMIISELAGISVFATGGIGGVHRGAQRTFDISADLEELSSTSVLVVCAGAKSILDLGLTLEYLETKGVPVIGYGTDELPAFYTSHSGYKVDYRMDTPESVASAWSAKLGMGLRGGMVIANPVPPEYSMDGEVINSAITAALEKADSLGIKGKAVTPFLLAEIKDITGGESLKANIALVRNNAALAAEIACAMSARNERTGK